MSRTQRHISYDRLADFVDRRLPDGERTPVESHLATCSRCAADAAWLERIAGLMRTDDAEDAPPYVIARAVRLFRGPEASATTTLGRRILAALRFDSGQQPLALGMRGQQPVPRQLLLSADAHEIDLRAAPAGALWTVSGQVLGPGEGGSIELKGSAGAVQAPLNELREFTLPPVAPGSYSLRLLLSGVEIEVPELELGG